MLLNRVMYVFLLPLFTSYLTREDYGVSAVASVLTLLATGLFNLGTGNAMGICYFDLSDPKERPAVVWTTVGLVSASAAVLTTVAVLAAGPLSRLALGSPDHARVIGLAFLALALQTVAEPLWGYLRIEQRAWTFAVLSVFATMLTLTLSVAAVVVMRRGV